MTSEGNEGFLSDIAGLEYTFFKYNWSSSKLKTLWNLIKSQIWIFFYLFKYRKRDVRIYINTVLPFGAAIAGKILAKKVIYHIHETSIKPKALKSFLFGVVNFCADDAIYVSKFLHNQEPMKRPENHTVYNALSEKFILESKAFYSLNENENDFRVLMLCSLKAYKGVFEFIELARKNINMTFDLVLNASKEEIASFLKEEKIPFNLNLYPKQKNVHPFYRKANVVLNCSIPGEWNETFGMTALEAMQYGKPVIVPPVGGIAEIVDHGQQGFQCDSRNISKMTEHLDTLYSNPEVYNKMANAALMHAQNFTISNFSNSLVKIITQKKNNSALALA